MNYKQTLEQLMADTVMFAHASGHPVPPLELFSSEEEGGIRVQILANNNVIAEKLCRTEQDQQMMCHDMLTMAIACLCKELTREFMERELLSGIATILHKKKSDA